MICWWHIFLGRRGKSDVWRKRRICCREAMGETCQCYQWPIRHLSAPGNGRKCIRVLTNRMFPCRKHRLFGVKCNMGRICQSCPFPLSSYGESLMAKHEDFHFFLTKCQEILMGRSFGGEFHPTRKINLFWVICLLGVASCPPWGIRIIFHHWVISQPHCSSLSHLVHQDIGGGHISPSGMHELPQNADMRSSKEVNHD